MTLLEAARQAFQQGDLAEAERLVQQALQADDADVRVSAAVVLGGFLQQSQRLAEAEAVFAEAVARDGGRAELQDALGSVRFTRGNNRGAIDAYRAAVSLRPEFAEAHYNLGNALRDSGDGPGAEQAFTRAALLRPALAEAHNNLGNLRVLAGDAASAIPHYRRALEVRPEMVEAWFNLGNAFKDCARFQEALDSYREAIRRNPRHAGAYNNAGEALEKLDRPAEAVECYRRACACDPNLFQPRRNLGSLLLQQKRLPEAAAMLEQAAKLQSDDAASLATLLHVRLHACQWNDLDGIIARIRAAAPTGAAPPFMLATLPIPNAEQTTAARRWAETFSVGAGERLSPSLRPPGPRLRLGYLSGDFHSHATAFLLAEVLEMHDRDHFAVTAYSYGPDDNSPLRQRLVDACEAFVDLRGLTDRQAAELIDEDEIDILVDLKGYTEGARTRILAYRPAPIQVNWLGYPGSMGAPFIDYVIGDDLVGPLAFQADCDERIVRLPHCFQPNDRQRPRPASGPSRRDCGLPDDGFVFCCFNNSYKILPPVFDIWMKLLAQVPGSVLWLLEANAAVRDNLQAAAAERGIAAERLVFAPRAPLPDHLARHLAADLFLDTLPVNALTTASDALWIGLPVLTCLGDTVASRGCASLLRAVGLPELITPHLAGYEALALALATDPPRLRGLRQRLREQGPQAPLFDTPRFTRDLERAFRLMHAISAAGEAPSAFSV